MKAVDRERYLVLTTIDLPNGGSAIMCTFCKFAEWYQEGACDEGYAECKHSLADRYGFPAWGRSLEAGEDCWGFRPKKDMTPEDAAEIVGIWLTGQVVVGFVDEQSKGPRHDA